jgi:hypothetical protein
VDSGGGDADRPFGCANALQALRYRAAVFRDDDKKPSEAVEAEFQVAGGEVIAWREGRALEDELFLSLTDKAVDKLIDCAIELHDKDLINDHIKSVSRNARDLSAIESDANRVGYSPDDRAILGRAARTYEFLEGRGIGYAIRLPANPVLQERIGYLLERPLGRPPLEVRHYYGSFGYQAQSWKKSRRVVAKVE